MNVRSRRTLLLAVVALLLLGANIWWLTRRAGDTEPAFVLGGSSTAITVDSSELGSLPMFEGKSGWTVQGRPLSSLQGYVRQPDDPQSKTGGASQPYVLVALPAKADAETMQAMLLSLVRENLCAVAVVQMDEKRATGTSLKAFVQRIVLVRDEDGGRQSCRAA